MADQDSANPSPEAAPAGRASRASLRPLVIAYAAAFAGIASLATAVEFAGTAESRPRIISLKLREFPSAPQETEVTPAAASRALREAGGNLLFDPALAEDSRNGPLPKIGPDGRTALAAYAGKFDSKLKLPKIAVVIRGLGVGAANTERALKTLHPAVTLAFVPFVTGLQSQIDTARGAGHEVLIEIPMEPFDFPDSDPGPHMLLASGSTEANAKELDWTLSRATGYSGIMNLLGGRFLGEEGPTASVLEQTAHRGLMFFDNGAAASSLAATLAPRAKATIAVGTLTIDGVQSKTSIDAKFSELEAVARRDGFAIGVGSAYPVSIARVQEWARGAEARGFQIVPVSALAKIPGNRVAANRK